jgi:hypothetical protein
VGEKKTIQDTRLKEDLEALVEPFSRGDPEYPLQWVCKSTRRLSYELNQQGHATSHCLVGRLLKELKYSLQANHKTIEGAKEHPDRDAPFCYIFKGPVSTARTTRCLSGHQRRTWGITRIRGRNTARKAFRERWRYTTLSVL